METMIMLWPQGYPADLRLFWIFLHGLLILAPPIVEGNRGEQKGGDTIRVMARPQSTRMLSSHTYIKVGPYLPKHYAYTCLAIPWDRRQRRSAP